MYSAQDGKKTGPSVELTSRDQLDDVGTGSVSTLPETKAFSLWSVLGVNYSLTCTPIAIGTYLSVSIGVGGSPVFFFGYILAACMNLVICACLAEMAAIFPHSSGQVYWTAAMAPPKYARGASYIVGWLTSAGYWFWTAASLLITSQLVWALVQICDSTFIVHPWHYYLGYFAVGLVSLAFNVPLFRWYPKLLKGFVVYINTGAIFIVIVLLVRAHPKQGAAYVFKEIVNLTGWSSNGVVFFLGLLPGLTAVNGFDCAAHMAEEVPDPRRQVPQVMLLSAIMSAISGFPMILVYMFSITNPENLLTPVGGQPIAQLLYDSLDSLPLTVISLVVFILAFVTASITMLTTWSRVWWTLAREGGAPFAEFLGRTKGESKLPVNAIMFAFVACMLIGLLELGSATALNAVLSGAVLCIFASYAVPIFFLLLSKRRDFVPKHLFDLGSLMGTVMNVMSLSWICFVFVWLCFPLYVPVTLSTMNWAVVVFFGVLALSGINWVAFSRRNFQAPTAYM